MIKHLGKIGRKRMAKPLINRQLKKLGMLSLKTAVIIATIDEYNNNSAKGKLKDYKLYYVHGVIGYDLPYLEMYLISTTMEFTKADEVIKSGDLHWVQRSEVITLKEIAKLRMDNAEYKKMVRRCALLAELKTVTEAKEKKHAGE